jgi:hypothetical protein
LFGLLGIMVTTSEMNEVLLKLCSTGALKSAKVVVPANNRTARGLWASSPVRTQRHTDFGMGFVAHRTMVVEQARGAPSAVLATGAPHWLRT